jgi:hypothetical protein
MLAELHTAGESLAKLPIGIDNISEEKCLAISSCETEGEGLTVEINSCLPICTPISDHR